MRKSVERRKRAEYQRLERYNAIFIIVITILMIVAGAVLLRIHEDKVAERMNCYADTHDCKWVPRAEIGLDPICK